MRRLALAAAAALAACSVELEGAPCGTDANCPDGQACGYDGKCSVEAAQCAQPACRPSQKTCGQDGTVVSCTSSGGGVCGTFPASGEPCPAAQTCGAGAACVASYAVVISAPVAGTVVGSAGVEVTVEVTRTSNAVSVADVSLTVDGSVFFPSGLPVQQGLKATYGIHYAPPAGTEKSVGLVAKAQPGTADETASAPVSVVADTVSPLVSAPTLSCSLRTTCWRDDTVTVSVAVSEPNLDGVSVVLDLDAGKTVQMTSQGAGVYQAQLDLRQWTFPAFTRSVTATVTALDLAGNAKSEPSSITVSRLRWARAVETGSPPQLTGAAIDGSGNVVVAGMNSKLYVLSPSGSIANVPPVVGSIGIAAAPSIGPSAIWVGGQDGRIYAVKSDGSSVLASCPASVTAGSLFTPALTSTPWTTAERAYSGGSNKRIYAVDLGSPGLCTSPGNNSTDAVTTSLLLGGGMLFAATATGVGAASVRQFLDASDGAFTPGWVAALTDGITPCQQVEAPLAADATSGILAACGNGQIYRVDRGGGTFAKLMTLAGKATESVVVRADGDLVVGTNDNLLHRLTPGTPPALAEKWTPLDLTAAVTGVALAARDALGVDVYAVTAAGDLYAVDADASMGGSPAGVIVWSTAGATSPPLGTASLRFPAIAPAQPNELPTLYAPSADGKVYAVVVDSPLDALSPWPKPHRDLGNTGSAP